MKEHKEKYEAVKPKVTRSVILIRHGQYEQNIEDPEEMKLTELGRKQATLTGKRLADLLKKANETIKDENGNNIPIKLRLVKSTMVREIT